jgi:hypothetical protein
VFIKFLLRNTGYRFAVLGLPLGQRFYNGVKLIDLAISLSWG